MTKMRSLKLIITVLTFACLTALALNSHGAEAAGYHSRYACDTARAGKFRCQALLKSDGANQPLSTTSYSSGYTPQDLLSAYKQPAAPKPGSTFNFNGQTIAIVDAYDNPYAAADLVKYRQQFKLPLCKTTVSKPTTSQLTSCFFTKYNQQGRTSPLPPYNSGWAKEIALDIEMASAMCPNCKIMLVESSSTSITNLGLAVDAAAAKNPNSISNSYGGTEFSSETSSTYANHYNHPGIPITVSAGDDGYGAEFPASSPYVTAVGGTSLHKDGSSRGWSETVWGGSGSGCSAYVARQVWQSAVGSCAKRVVADVAAVADSATGVAVYDNGRWYVLGGTSVGAPIIASIYAQAGNSGGAHPAMRYAEYLYAHQTNLFDVTSGTNGSCVSNLALCNAGIGYDGPTGLGTPNTVKAF